MDGVRDSQRGWKHSGLSMWLVLGFLLALLASGCAPHHISLTKQGDALLQKGDRAGAQSKYTAAVKSFPKYAPAIYRLGRMAAEDGKWEDAGKYFTATTVADPQMKEAWRWKGEAELKGGQLEPAMASFNKARELGDTELWLGLGIVSYLTGDYETAFAALEEAVGDPKTSGAAAPYLLKSALASGAFSQAAEVLKKAALPTSATEAALLWRLRAELNYLNRNYPAADEALRKVQEKGNFGFWYREASPALLSRLSGVKGAVVEYTHLGSPAARAGLQPGDVVTSFERKPVRTAAELTTLLAAYRKRPTLDEVLIEVYRAGEQMAFRLTPDAFQTRSLIEQAQEGKEPVTFIQAPVADLVFP